MSKKFPETDLRLLPVARGLAAFLAIGLALGCGVPLQRIDGALAREARLALLQVKPPDLSEEEAEEEKAVEPYAERESPRKSVFLAELLAIFPGFFWHGLGHQYAGDSKTARELREVGAWGYLLTAVGGGVVVGGYFLDTEADSQWDGYALSLYISGGITAGIGGGFFLTAWIYDIIDTPRAIRTGGAPAPESPFQKDLEGLEGSK